MPKRDLYVVIFSFLAVISIILYDIIHLVIIFTHKPIMNTGNYFENLVMSCSFLAVIIFICLRKRVRH
jgi:hypothetical protein